MLDTKAPSTGWCGATRPTPDQAERILGNRLLPEHLRSRCRAPRSTWRRRSSTSSPRRATTTWSSSTRRRRATHSTSSMRPSGWPSSSTTALYKVLMTPTRGIVKAVNVAAQALIRSLSPRWWAARSSRDAIAFFQAFEGMETGLQANGPPQSTELLRAGATAFVLVASPKADTVAEADYFADRTATATTSTCGRSSSTGCNPRSPDAAATAQRAAGPGAVAREGRVAAGHRAGRPLHLAGRRPAAGPRTRRSTWWALPTRLHRAGGAGAGAAVRGDRPGLARRTRRGDVRRRAPLTEPDLPRICPDRPRTASSCDRGGRR